jgi:hypothetical protein
MASVKDALATFAKNIETQTGKTIADWGVLVKKSGHEKHGQIVAFLKEKHSLGHGAANFIAKETLKAGSGSDSDLLEAQFAGAKAALKPLYDKLAAVVQSLGKDVELAPKKNNVSVRRTKQFALLQPSTTKRIDVGLILKGVAPKGRLEASGSFNAMFTHRVRIEAEQEIDAELKKWLKAAYDAA